MRPRNYRQTEDQTSSPRRWSGRGVSLLGLLGCALVLAGCTGSSTLRVLQVTLSNEGPGPSLPIHWGCADLSPVPHITEIRADLRGIQRDYGRRRISGHLVPSFRSPDGAVFRLRDIRHEEPFSGNGPGIEFDYRETNPEFSKDLRPKVFFRVVAPIVNLRSGPGRDYRDIGDLSKGQLLASYFTPIPNPTDEMDWALLGRDGQAIGYAALENENGVLLEQSNDPTGYELACDLTQPSAGDDRPSQSPMPISEIQAKQFPKVNAAIAPALDDKISGQSMVFDFTPIGSDIQEFRTIGELVELIDSLLKLRKRPTSPEIADNPSANQLWAPPDGASPAHTPAQGQTQTAAATAKPPLPGGAQIPPAGSIWGISRVKMDVMDQPDVFARRIGYVRRNSTFYCEAQTANWCKLAPRHGYVCVSGNMAEKCVLEPDQQGFIHKGFQYNVTENDLQYASPDLRLGIHELPILGADAVYPVPGRPNWVFFETPDGVQRFLNKPEFKKFIVSPGANVVPPAGTSASRVTGQPPAKPPETASLVRPGRKFFASMPKSAARFYRKGEESLQVNNDPHRQGHGLLVFNEPAALLTIQGTRKCDISVQFRVEHVSAENAYPIVPPCRFSYVNLPGRIAVPKRKNGCLVTTKRVGNGFWCVSAFSTKKIMLRWGPGWQRVSLQVGDSDRPLQVEFDRIRPIWPFKAQSL